MIVPDMILGLISDEHDPVRMALMTLESAKFWDRLIELETRVIIDRWPTDSPDSQMNILNRHAIQRELLVAMSLTGRKLVQDRVQGTGES